MFNEEGLIELMQCVNWNQQEQQDYLNKQRKLIKLGLPEKSLSEYMQDITYLDNVNYLSKVILL